MKNRLMSGLALFAFTFSCAAATRYVAPTNGGGSDAAGNDGTNRNAPLATITNALALSAIDDTIVLLTGTHKLTSSITVDKRLTMFGDGAKEEVIIDGQNNGPVLNISATGALLHSFSVIRMSKNNTNYLGINLTGNSTISNLVVRNNGNEINRNGSRFPIVASKGVITCCYITNNIAYGNTGVGLSGAVTMENCYIAGNVTQNNNSMWPAVVYVTSKDAIVRNCTIINNRSKGYGALYVKAAAKIQNNIIYGNTDYDTGAVNNWTLSGASVTNNCYGNCSDPRFGAADKGNIGDNPYLKDDAMHFYRVSPCNHTAVVDPSKGVYATEYDMDGNPRGEHPSIGAFEYVDSGQLSCLVEATGSSVLQPSTVTLSVQFDGSYTEPLSYAWDFNGDGVVDSTAATPVLNAVGVYSPSVTVTDADSKSASALFKGRIVIYAEGGNVYVTSQDNPASAPPYSTWATAATSLHDAMDYALSGKSVVLDAGVHLLTNQVHVAKAVTITSTNGAESTSFRRKGTGNYQFFWLDNASAVLKDISIENGMFDNYQVGAMVKISAGKVLGCRFVRNVVDGQGGVTVESDNASVERCVFAWNTSKVKTGNIQGPAVLSLGSGGSVRDCLFVGNTNRVTPSMNAGYLGGAIRCTANNAKIYNSTFVGNVTFANLPGGIYNLGKGTVRNCISYGNLAYDAGTGLYTDANGIGVAQGTGPNKISNCCVYPLTENHDGYVGIVGKNPLFKNEAKGDFRLAQGSPCINAGTNLHFNASYFDLDGNPRIHKFEKSGIIDIGCYEAASAPPFYLYLE